MSSTSTSSNTTSSKTNNVIETITYNSVNVTTTAISKVLSSILESIRDSSTNSTTNTTTTTTTTNNNISLSIVIEQLGPYIELLHTIFTKSASICIQQLPILKDIIITIIDTIFIPKIICKQLIVLITLETTIVTIKHLVLLLNYIFVSSFSSKYRLIQLLQYQQQNIVTTQDEWMDIAERIDTIQGNDIWRSDPYCPLYEQERIQSRIDEYIHLMRRRDIFELLFLLRGSIGRSKFGLLHEGLFTKALAGSKVLTETYHNVVCSALDFVCDAPNTLQPTLGTNGTTNGHSNTNIIDNEPIPTDARLAFFNETRHAYGRTALLLSGGAALGFYHIGLVKALMENGLMPRVIGGSSAGSIVCAMIGTRTDNECLNDLFNVKGTIAHGHSNRIKLNFFRPLQKDSVVSEDEESTTSTNNNNNNTRTTGSTFGFLQVYTNTAGAFHDAKRTIQGLMPLTVRHITSFLYDLLTGNTRPQDIFKNDTEHFRECVRDNVGDFTFQEAFDRTGRILNIVVTPNNASDPPRLLNYLTAPHVMVWSAAVASSSLPGVFEANRLVVKEADGWERYESNGSGAAQQVFSDGSMEQDLPMQQLSEMFNINHFIISQANPHAVLFASYTQKMSVWENPITGIIYQILIFMRNQCRSWLLNLVQCVGARRITPLFETQRGIGTQFFTQEYEGRPTDISLVPWLGHRSVLSALLHIIYNPSEAEFRQWIQAAERETWKYIPAIKSHIAEEITLDRCVQRLRRRLLQENITNTNTSTGTNEQQNKVLALQTGNHLHPAFVMQQNHNHNQQPNTVTNDSRSNDSPSPPPGTGTGTGRVPSFFTSHSLVNLSGLSIGDQQHTGIELHESILYDYAMPAQYPLLFQTHDQVATVVTNNGIISGPGWGGLGLRGNRSSGNLHRNLSDATISNNKNGGGGGASGFFIDNNTNIAVGEENNYPTTTTQDAGESTGGVIISNINTTTTTTGSSVVDTSLPNVVSDGMNTLINTGTGTGATGTSSRPMGYVSNNMSSHDSEQSMNSSTPSPTTAPTTASTSASTYIKTTSMARFYYRKSDPGDDYLQQHPSLASSSQASSSQSQQRLLQRQRTSSMSALATATDDNNNNNTTTTTDNSTDNSTTITSTNEYPYNTTTDSTGVFHVDSYGLVPSRPLVSTRHNRKKSQSYSNFLSPSNNY